MENLVNEKTLTCGYCNVKNKDIKAFNEHLNGKRHKKIVEKASKSNTEPKIGELKEEDLEKFKISKIMEKKNKKLEQLFQKVELESKETSGEKSQKEDEIYNFGKILGEMNLKLYDVPSDGHCLYHSICHQLSSREIKYGSNGYMILKKQVADNLRKNRGRYEPFIDLNGSTYENYCNRVEKSAQWGDNVEIQAVSDLLKLPITIYHSNGTTNMIGTEYSGQPILICLLEHALSAGFHYNSTTGI